MSIKDGGPAFPTDDQERQAGMSLRDYFAAQALPAVITAYVHGNGACLGTDHILRNASGIAFKFADAMLIAREEQR
jgi:hypothetical protein